MHFLLALAAIGWTQPALSQPNPASTANRAVQIAQAREHNAALMHQYNWNSRTELVVQGQVKDTRIEQVSYGPNGQLQRTTLNDQSSRMPIGFLRRAIAESEKEKMHEFLTGLRGVLEQYTLPTTGKILDFMMSASPSLPDAQGLIKLSGNNVVQPGDNLSMWINPWTKHLQHIQVNTTYQGDAAQLTATFATVPVSGLNYTSFAEVTVPAKQLSVQVQNYNYARLAY
ncbi:MAG TPA: hypothetical protein VF104_12995 [Burkholderiales bacterium]